MEKEKWKTKESNSNDDPSGQRKRDQYKATSKKDFLKGGEKEISWKIVTKYFSGLGWLRESLKRVSKFLSEKLRSKKGMRWREVEGENFWRCS